MKLKKLKKRKRTESNDTEVEDTSLLRSLYSQVVLDFLQCHVLVLFIGLNFLVKKFILIYSQLSQSVFVKFLLHLHDKIMPNMRNPLVLTDFLVASFSKGQGTF